MTSLSMLNFFSPPDDVLHLVALCEELGNFTRFWIGEHHNPNQVADPLTVAMLAAATTKSIRVGTGAVSLTFRNPYMVAESAFLAELMVPGRIDLGVTRAAAIDNALLSFFLDCVDVKAVNSGYENRVRLLRALLLREESKVPAYLSGKVTQGPPIFLMGQGPARGRLAGELGVGLCSSFHHGGNVRTVRETLDEYQQHFRPSAMFEKPYKILCVSGHVSDDLEELERVKLDLDNKVRASYEGIFPFEINVFSSSKHAVAELSQYCEAVGANEVMFLPLGNPASCARALSSGWNLPK